MAKAKNVTLAALVAATNSAGFMYADPKTVEKLVQAGYAEVNTASVNPDNVNEVAVRASENGIAANKQSAPEVSTVTTYQFEMSPALPKRTRASTRTSKYDFDSMPEPRDGMTAKFFVPATEKMPHPEIALTSTITNANRKYSTVVGQKPGKNRKGEEVMKNVYAYSRQFALNPGVDKDGNKGAWVERVK